VNALTKSLFVNQLAELLICDKARIRKTNTITCPLYADHVGEYKSECLTHLARQGLGKHTAIKAHSLVSWIEKLDWYDLLDSRTDEGGHIVVLVGLDNWSGRLSVTQDIRAYAAARPNWAERITQIQIGIDRCQASVSVFGSSFAQVCPACGKAQPLPTPEPCACFNERRELVRGTLLPEASSAAQAACYLIGAILSGQRAAWINTKTNLVGHESDPCLSPKLTRVCQSTPGCLGAHTPVSPLRWDEETLKTVDGSV